MAHEKIEAYLLSEEKKREYKSRRISAIQKHRLFYKKTVDLAAKEANPEDEKRKISLELETRLKKSSELFSAGTLSQKSFIEHYRETTDIRQWPGIIVEVREGALDIAAAELELAGFYLADNVFAKDKDEKNQEAKKDKFKMFSFLHVHIPPDQVFLNNIANLEYSNYIFDAERIVTLPKPGMPEISPDAAIEMADVRGIVFPEGFAGLSVPDDLGADIRIGIVDSGVDKNHPDFRGRIIEPRDFTDEGDGKDNCGHGTHVAGIAAGGGRASNGKFAGITRLSEIVDAKVFDAAGSASTQQILAGMRWVFEKGAQVINLSLGTRWTDTDGKSILTRACNTLARNGIVVCVSAGNEGPGEGSLSVPGDARDAICVAAVDKNREIAGFSSRGPTDDEDLTGPKPDLAAPGVDVIAAKSGDCSFPEYPGHSEYTALSGTSMSTPVVAGLCALLLSFGRLKGQALESAAIKTILLESAMSLGSDMYSQGKGLVNGSMAFKKLSNYLMGQQDMQAQEKETQSKYIGKYKIIRPIGRGGFGEVWEVKAPNLSKPRAMKILNQEYAYVGRELAEAEMQDQISHPAVLHVEDATEIDGKCVIVMEYAAGGNLRKKLESQGSLPLEEAIAHIKELAGALGEAHDHNILHCDIKPENILFDEKGHIKLADFGIAGKMEKASRIKRSKIIGTVEYMAPEQLEGELRKESDIWSLGTVFYEMVTGETCFYKKGQGDVETMDRIRKADFVPVKKTRNGKKVPARIDGVIKEMLALDPAKRPTTMGKVIKELDQYIKEQSAPRAVLSMWPGLILLLISILSFCGVAYFAHMTGLIKLPFLPPAVIVEPVSIPDKFLRLDFEDQLEQGYALIEKREYPLAYQVLNNISANAKDSYLRERAAFFKASVALHHMQNPDLAIADFESFLEQVSTRNSPLAGHAHFFLGQIYLQAKSDFYKAISHLTAVIEKHPDSNKADPAKRLLQEAGMRLAKEGGSFKHKLKNFISNMLPKSATSSMIQIFSSLLTLLGSLAWIATSLVKAPGDVSIDSQRPGLIGWFRKYAIVVLIIFFVVCQVAAYSLNWHQSNLERQQIINTLRSEIADTGTK